MKYLAVDSDGFPIDPKESTDVVIILFVYLSVLIAFSSEYHLQNAYRCMISRCFWVFT